MQNLCVPQKMNGTEKYELYFGRYILCCRDVKKLGLPKFALLHQHCIAVTFCGHDLWIKQRRKHSVC